MTIVLQLLENSKFLKAVTLTLLLRSTYFKSYFKILYATVIIYNNLYYYIGKIFVSSTFV